jgi:hypothetical protein
MVTRVDSAIVTAIRDYITSRNIDQQQFAQEMGVSNPCITKWLKVGNGITEQKWKVLFPKIKNFLPKDNIYINDAGFENYSSSVKGVSGYIFEPKYTPAMVHMIPMTELAEFDNIVTSVTQFGSDIGAKKIAYHAKHTGKNSVLAVNVDSDKYAPIIPRNTTLFVCADAPNVGSLVVVKLNDGTVTLAKYSVDNDKQFALLDVVSEHPFAICKIAAARQLINWIFPVLYYEVVTF